MTVSSPVRVGIIGLGAIGQRLIKNFAAHSETEIVAVCDVSESLAKQIASELHGISWYTDHREMLAKADMELVYVGVPPKFHYRIVMDVLDARKHILCEKPLANQLDEARDMMERAERVGVVHALNFPLHYSAEVLEMERRIQGGWLGDLRRIDLITHFPQWPRSWQQNDWVGGREQGGFVLEVGVHFIETIQRLFGPIHHVQSRLEFPDDPARCETGVMATMELEDGTPILFNGLSQVPGKEHIAFEAYGTNGVLSLLNWSHLQGALLGEEALSIQPAQPMPTSLLTNVVKAIRGESGDLCDFRVGYEAQVVLEQLRGKH